MIMIHILRYIPFSLILGIVVSACSDSESDAPSLYDSPETYITFSRPGINLSATVGDFATTAPSRSIIINSSSEIQNFKVWGFCIPRNISGAQSESSAALDWNRKSKFFTAGADVKLNGDGKTDNSVVATLASGSTTYNGGSLAKWYDNANAQYSFIAVSDNSAANYTEYTMGNADATSGKEHGPQLKVTLPISGNVTNHNDIPDIMVAATFDHNAADGRVPLSFFHIMTGIRFKFVNHTDKELRINSVTYSGNFYREATFDFTTDSPTMEVNTSNTYNGNFTLVSLTQNIPASASDYVSNAYMGGNENPTTLLLLPNPKGTTESNDNNFVLGTNKEIRIEYSLEGDTKPRDAFVLGDNFTLNYIPKPNTLHTAYFNFVGDGFIVVFQADNTLNWEDGNENGSSNITIM